jgi:carboxylate-amine ligase
MAPFETRRYEPTTESRPGVALMVRVGCRGIVSPEEVSAVAAETHCSVSEDRFGSSEPYTLGIEEEYMLLDPETLDLVQRADTILDADKEGEFAAQTSCELFQSEIEAHTPICADVSRAAVELSRLRDHLQVVSRQHGLLLASAGTHPSARYEDQLVSDRPRYLGIVEQVQYPARRELIFGLHVHIGVPTAAAAIRAMRLLRPQLASLVALSASSPFWRGFQSGLASTRHSVFATFPRSGVPPAFEAYSQYREFVATLERGGLIEDYTRIWWDIRPHPRLGTIEMRTMDAVERREDAITLAALVQALVKRAVEAPPPPPATALEDEILRENKWQAVRHGLDANLVRAKGDTITIHDYILRTLDDLAATAAELGSERMLETVEQMARTGNGASRQLATYANSGDIQAVTAAIAAETSGALLDGLQHF